MTEDLQYTADYYFVLDTIRECIKLNTGRTADHYKEERESFFILDPIINSMSTFILIFWSACSLCINSSCFPIMRVVLYPLLYMSSVCNWQLKNINFFLASTAYGRLSARSLVLNLLKDLKWSLQKRLQRMLRFLLEEVIIKPQSVRQEGKSSRQTSVQKLRLPLGGYKILSRMCPLIFQSYQHQ